jgi:hypothetical protein
MRQPRLLSSSPPCQVLLFPMTKRIGKIRHTAQILTGKQEEGAAIYWRQVIAAAQRHFARVGVTDSEADRQMGEFFAAVQSELAKFAHKGHGSGDAK